MKISADDWHFRSFENDMLVLDLYLSNGQHTLLEIYPMKNPNATNGQIPEMIVFCEFPGERLAEGHCVGRWISRPPDRSCPWSNVQIPPALLQQIRQRLGYQLSPQAVTAS
jgi:hypothetical protein